MDITSDIVSRKDTAEKQLEATRKGMRFWIPGIKGNMPPEFKVADEPFPKGGFPGEYRNARLTGDDGQKFSFRGECWVMKKSLCKYLIENRGKCNVRFDPQEAVDRIGIDPEWLRGLGLDVKGEAAAVPEVDEAPEVAEPNLHLMTKAELTEHADGFGIHIPVRMAKDDAVEHFEKKRAEQLAAETEE